MGNAESNSWSKNYKLIKEIHDKAYKCIDDAITLEEQELANEAVDKYSEGINIIDKALDVVIAYPDNPDETWQDACNMVQKMKKTRADVVQRINAITIAPDYVHREPPPSYEEVVQESNQQAIPDCPRTYCELAEALDNLKVGTPKGDADVLITCESVIQYFISTEGNVTTLEPQKLYIAFIADEGEIAYFLKIGTWIYPLVPGVSPCYRTEYRAYIFPDVHSAVGGATVGIVIPEDADQLILEILEDILLGVIKEESNDKDIISRARRSPAYPQPAAGSGVAQGIVNGAGYISKGLIFTAEKFGELLNYTTPKLISSMTPAPAQTTVPQNLSKTFKVAENTTGKAAELTENIANKLGVATSKLGQYLAPHVEKQGSKLLTHGFHYSEEEAATKVGSVLTVAAGAVEGFATIYQGLHTSASILGNNVKDNSVKIIKHKYGESAGSLANDTLGTVGNVISIRGNVKIFTPKGLIKSTTKQTGKALVRSAAASALMHTQGEGSSTQFTEPQSLEFSKSLNTSDALLKNDRK